MDRESRLLSNNLYEIGTELSSLRGDKNQEEEDDLNILSEELQSGVRNFFSLSSIELDDYVLLNEILFFRAFFVERSKQ